MIRGADPFDFSAEATRAPVRYGLLAVSFVAFVGLVALSYSLGNRDVANNAVPFVRADNQPTKVRPENPGGTVFAKNDIGTVYERRHGDGTVQPEALAPEVEQQARTAPAVQYQAPPPPVALPQAVPAPTQSTAAPTTPAATTPVPSAQVVKSAVDLHKVAPAPKPQPAAKAPVAKSEPIKAKPVVAPAVAPRPVENIIASLSVPTNTSATVAYSAHKDAKPATAIGRGVVQLVSVKDPQEAKKMAASLASRFGDVLPAPQVVRADLGARGVYYRLRAHFSNAEQANKACALIKERGQNCVVLSD